MELLKDYDMSLQYHPGKANVVADALSRLSMSRFYHIEEGKREMVKDILRLANLGVRLLDSEDGGVIVHEIAKSSLCAEVKEKQISGYIVYARCISRKRILDEVHTLSIDLSNNDFHGELPPEFSRLPKLRVINLSYNNFIGEIPIGIATLPSLKWFVFGYNKLLNGSNVLTKFNISTLEILDFREAGLTGDSLSDLCRRLPRLQKLALGSNMLSGEIPRTITECSELQLLMLFRNNFVGAIPRQLCNLQLLQHLDLRGNKLKVFYRLFGQAYWKLKVLSDFLIVAKENMFVFTNCSVASSLVLYAYNLFEQACGQRRGSEAQSRGLATQYTFSGLQT
ncbi:hypothetical protein CQW23_04249 [Capsicum baccatum]|uniref:Uncharacterized protein n=1 Tax=Capsicum baccatum TaxID=33114 RepID=A0A2G2XE38_CAPBA|nr:hypothetical protein CQW23_04249 [Capsicum baccatum]